ncbi:MFS transporter [Streptomyces sp. SM12]|uniref:MFS transporter n=1 Tax=Streptomyces sp. SM12 TaxID=1071602 RepID=UPI00215665B5|nr:MFS transporter [Streptomyces sp. SM12]
MARVPQLRRITLASCLAIFGAAGLTLTAVLLATGFGTPERGGLLMGLLGGGALAASVAVARRTPPVGPAALAGAGLLISAVGLLGAAIAADFWVCALCFALAGAGEGPVLSATLRIRADHAPPGARAQVFTLGAGLKITAAAAGTALAALLAGRLAPEQLLLFIAALNVVAAATLIPAPRPRAAGPGGPAAAAHGG